LRGQAGEQRQQRRHESLHRWFSPADAGRVKAARADGGDSNTGRGGRGRGVAAALAATGRRYDARSVIVAPAPDRHRSRNAGCRFRQSFNDCHHPPYGRIFVARQGLALNRPNLVKQQWAELCGRVCGINQ
jgi:hypothetical protein